MSITRSGGTYMSCKNNVSQTITIVGKDDHTDDTKVLRQSVADEYAATINQAT